MRRITIWSDFIFVFLHFCFFLFQVIIWLLGVAFAISKDHLEQDIVMFVIPALQFEITIVFGRSTKFFLKTDFHLPIKDKYKPDFILPIYTNISNSQWHTLKDILRVRK